MQKELIINYLILANVNENILNYVIKHKLEIFTVIKSLLGKDFEFFSNKEQNVQKLKNGNECFKILEDGSMWFKTSYNPNKERRDSKFYKSGSINADENKYLNITNCSYITFENGHIIDRQVIIKSTENNLFDGWITETIYNNTIRFSSKESYWKDSITNEIPNEKLITTTKVFNEFGFAISTTNEKINYHNDAWSFVLNGEYVNTSILEESSQRKTLFSKLVSLKNNLLQKKNQEKNIKR